MNETGDCTSIVLALYFPFFPVVFEPYFLVFVQKNLPPPQKNWNE
jgi:hypothetical protein